MTLRPTSVAMIAMGALGFLSVGGCTRKCRPGTIFVTLKGPVGWDKAQAGSPEKSFVDALSSADSVEVRVGDNEVATSPIGGKDLAKGASLALTLGEAYPKGGGEIDLSFAVLNQQVKIAEAITHAPLDESCTALEVILEPEPTVSELSVVGTPGSSCVQLQYKIAHPHALGARVFIELDGDAGFVTAPGSPLGEIETSVDGISHSFAIETFAGALGRPTILGLSAVRVRVGAELDQGRPTEDLRRIVFADLEPTAPAVHVDNRPRLDSGRRNEVGSRPEAIVSADFNADGRPDLATANVVGGTVSVLLGQADGSFAPAPSPGRRDYVVGIDPGAIVAADLDGDGAVDLATANEGSKSLSFLRNRTNGAGTGTGIFEPERQVPMASAPIALRAADVNGDGALDLVVATAGPSTGVAYVESLLNEAVPDGNIGTFAERKVSEVGEKEEAYPVELAVADFRWGRNLRRRDREPERRLDEPAARRQSWRFREAHRPPSRAGAHG